MTGLWAAKFLRTSVAVMSDLSVVAGIGLLAVAGTSVGSSGDVCRQRRGGDAYPLTVMAMVSLLHP